MVKLNSNPNMATTPMFQFIKPPEVFEVGNDIEKFIEESEKFFELTQTSEEHRGIFIKAFLSIEATRKFDEILNEPDYKKRIQKAFSRPANLAEDLKAALTYKRGGDSSSEFFKKIERLTKNVLRHDLNEEDFKIFLLQNALEDQELKRDLKMQELKTFEEMKLRINKTEEVRREIENEGEVSVINQKKSYANTVKNDTRWKQNDIRKREQFIPRTSNQSYQRYRPNFNNEDQLRNRMSRQNNFVSSNFRERQPKKCWACREEGHLRSECPNVQCSHCRKRGHFLYQCYEAKPERRQMNRKYVAAIHDGYEQPRMSWANNRHEEMRGDHYDKSMIQEDPNEYAPTSGEVIGAIN